MWQVDEQSSKQPRRQQQATADSATAVKAIATDAPAPVRATAAAGDTPGSAPAAVGVLPLIARGAAASSHYPALHLTH